jgi:hypothetical protein
MSIEPEKERKMNRIFLITGCSSGIGRDLTGQPFNIKQKEDKTNE